MADFWRDFRFALRTLSQGRAFTLVCILALALGVGCATVIFTVVYNVVFHPFPYPAADRFTYFYIHDAATGPDLGRNIFPLDEFLEYHQHTEVFDDLIGDKPISVVWARDDGSVQLDGSLLTANAFEFLGIQPLLGRMITVRDVQPGSSPVFAMSYRLWNTQFNHDSKLLGTSMVLNGQSRTLVAIMPPRFLYGDRDIWIPLPLNVAASQNLSDTGGQPLYLYAMGRLKPGVSTAQADSALTLAAHNIAKIYPERFPKQFAVVTEPLLHGLLGSFRITVYVLIAAVIILLLIACGTVANLLLVRATSREREMATRASLGASYARLIRQLLTESLVVASAVCIATFLFAYLGTKWANAVIPKDLVPAESTIQLDSVALSFALLLSILTTFICGLAPAFYLIRGNLFSRIADGSRRTGGGGRLRSSLVTAGFAFSVMLLTATGLTLRTFLALHRVGLGFNQHSVLAGRLITPYESKGSRQQKVLFLTETLRRLESLPGVISAASSSSAPPFAREGGPFTILGQGKSHQVPAFLELCSPKYFSTLEIRVLRGRSFSENDINGARLFAVINQSFARKAFGEEEPIGRQIQFSAFDQLPDAPHGAYFEIIGVVDDAKNRGLRQSVFPEVFLPYTITAYGSRALLLKTSVAPLSLEEPVRRELWQQDRSAVLGHSNSLENLIQRSELSLPNFILKLLSTFAIIALALSTLGILSVLAYAVSLEKHGIGIRMALGARRGNIVVMVLRKGILMILVGVFIGELASLGVSQVIASQLWGVSGHDAATLLAAALLLGLFGIAGCVVPAFRATQVEPASALRCE